MEGFPRVPRIDLHVQKGSRILSAFSLERILVTGTELYVLRKSLTVGWMNCLHRWESSTMYRPEQWVPLQSIIGFAERCWGDSPLYACPCLLGPWRWQWGLCTNSCWLYFYRKITFQHGKMFWVQLQYWLKMNSVLVQSENPPIACLVSIVGVCTLPKRLLVL